MSQWADCAIDDFFEYTIPGDWGSAPTTNNSVPVLRSTNITNEGKLDLKDVALRSVSPKRLANRRIGAGDILIEKSGGGPQQPAGRVAYCPDNLPGTCSNFIELAKVRNSFDSNFVFYLLHLLYENGLVLKYQQQTTGIINFKLTEYKTEIVSVPKDRSEQSTIASVLKTADRAIEQTEALIAKYQRIKTGMLYDLLTRGIDENGQLRDPITNDLSQPHLGALPNGWKRVQAESVCKDICVGIVIRPAQYYRPSGVPTLRSANVQEGHIKHEDMVFISSAANKQLAKSMLRTGYVVSVRTGYPGTSAVIPPEFDGANCIDLVISKPSSRILPDYLALWINSPFGKAQVLHGQGGLAQQHFNVAEMKKLVIHLPDPPEQQRIVKTFAIQTRLIDAELHRLNMLTRLKIGLMQDLLSGRVGIAPLIEHHQGELK